MSETPEPRDPMADADEPVEPSAPFHHTVDSIYVYSGTEPTMHRVLGLLEPGDNRFPTDEPVMVEALQVCCAEGLLHQVPAGEADTDEGAPA